MKIEKRKKKQKQTEKEKQTVIRPRRKIGLPVLCCHPAELASCHANEETVMDYERCMQRRGTTTFKKKKEKRK